MYYMGNGMYNFDKYLFDSKESAKQYLLELCNKSDDVHADIVDVYKRYGQVSMTEQWRIVKVLDWDKRVFDENDTALYTVEESIESMTILDAENNVVFLRSYCNV